MAFVEHPCVAAPGTHLSHLQTPSCAVPGYPAMPWLSRALSCGITGSLGLGIARHPAVPSLAVPSSGIQQCHSQHTCTCHSQEPDHATLEHPVVAPLHAVPFLWHLTMAPGCGISRYPAVPLPRHSTTTPLGHLAVPSPEHLAVLTHSQVHIHILGTAPVHRLTHGEPTCHCHFPMSLPTVAWWAPLLQPCASPPCHGSTCLHREYGTIDDVDIDLHVNISFLDEEVATAWKVLRTEPIVLRLRFSLSQYLDGPGEWDRQGVVSPCPRDRQAGCGVPVPSGQAQCCTDSSSSLPAEPSIEVFQPSNKEGFGLGLQLKKILGMFTSQQWKHLSNDFLKTQQEKRHSWFKTSGTIKKFRAGLSIFSPIPKSPSFPVIQDSVLKGKLGIPEPRVNRLMNRSVSCMVKNPKVEVFGYPPASTQAGVAPFNILVGGHCKNIPTLEYGFLVQVGVLHPAHPQPAAQSILFHLSTSYYLEHSPHYPIPAHPYPDAQSILPVPQPTQPCPIAQNIFPGAPHPTYPHSTACVILPSDQSSTHPHPSAWSMPQAVPDSLHPAPQIMKYAEQRIPTLNEYCVVCDEQHVFQNGSMLKPAVCTRELCVFSFYTLGVMSGAAEEVATGAEVVDLLVAMCRAALESPRKSIIFEPYPSVVDPNDPKTLAFNPKKKNYERLQKALDSVMSIREMTQGSYLEIKKQMDKLDPLAHPLLQWIISSNRSHIVKLPLSRLKFMHTSHQFLLLSSPPAKEARFRTAKKLYGSTFAFHGSHIENWHSILRNGLVNASYTKLQVLLCSLHPAHPRAAGGQGGGRKAGRGQTLGIDRLPPLLLCPSCWGDPTMLTLVFSCKLHGAAYGKGIYLSPISSISFGYSGKRLPVLPSPACAAQSCLCSRSPSLHGQGEVWHRAGWRSCAGVAASHIHPITPASSHPGWGFHTRQRIKPPTFSRLQKLLRTLLGGS
uniref:PARP catalytic domain-containing protein n=1 Tax=Ficedula albicollis TaxID=59894 RepID=A0A803V270_FICAL